MIRQRSARRLAPAGRGTLQRVIQLGDFSPHASSLWPSLLSWTRAPAQAKISDVRVTIAGVSAGPEIESQRARRVNAVVRRDTILRWTQSILKQRSSVTSLGGFIQIPTSHLGNTRRVDGGQLQNRITSFSFRNCYSTNAVLATQRPRKSELTRSLDYLALTLRTTFAIWQTRS